MFMLNIDGRKVWLQTAEPYLNDILISLDLTKRLFLHSDISLPQISDHKYKLLDYLLRITMELCHAGEVVVFQQQVLCW